MFIVVGYPPDLEPDTYLASYRAAPVYTCTVFCALLTLFQLDSTFDRIAHQYIRQLVRLLSKPFLISTVANYGSIINITIYKFPQL